jgi:ABC-type nickel/cobalt efflux system permease component RcnA
MNLLATVLAGSVATAEKTVPLIMPPIAFAAIAFGIFLLLGVVTWTYRDVANRHAHKAATSYHDDHEHGSAGPHH